MRLTRVYVRFYKSFNYDYERKAIPDAVFDAWDDLDGRPYPYVRMDVDPTITTVVGANESGKTHLLSAIEKLIKGVTIEEKDFCRYSAFNSVESGQMRKPDFGGEFQITTERDVALMAPLLGAPPKVGDRFRLFRPDGRLPVVYRDGSEPIELDDAQAVSLTDILPPTFRLNADVPLPDSVPIYELTAAVRQVVGDRRQRGEIFEKIFAQEWTDATWASQGLGLLSLFGGHGRAERVDEREQGLARSLLVTVANIDKRAFEVLAAGINEGDEGHVNGLIDRMNDALARHLNFPKWWAQDRDFRLMLSPRERELVFTIRDRTGTEYSFKERSSGLRFFLSYFVQLLAHERPEGRSEILLMDEPDAYLSSQGQQDLLRILEDFALPEDRSRHDQVLYVTHSPFLINRNAAHRIRVLDKGTGDEGTRVVKDATKNHYEPLRSSLGAFVAETAFIGGSNLFVEGLADQVLLAGMSSFLRAAGASSIETLDLNEVTIVPAGSAGSIPYLVYLARGRDEVRPPCVALLDGDDQGKQAVAAMDRGGAKGRQVLAREFVIEFDKWASDMGVTVAPGVRAEEPEDLIPIPIALAAARQYAQRVLYMSSEESSRLRQSDISGELNTDSGSLWDAVASAFRSRLDDNHIEKVGFAKEVVTYAQSVVGASPRPPGLIDLDRNFRQLLTHLTEKLHAARTTEENRRLANRLGRVVKAFVDDYPTGTTRDKAKVMLDEVALALDDTPASDEAKLEVERLRREFKLTESLTEQIERFDEFRERVSNLRYQPRLANQRASEAEAMPGAPATAPSAPVAKAKAAKPKGATKAPAKPQTPAAEPAPTPFTG